MSKRPEPRRASTRPAQKKTTKRKSTPRKTPKLPQLRRGFFVLLPLLWAALAVPELILHLATAKTGEMILNSGLLLAPLFALVPASLVCALCTSLRRRGNITVALIYGSLSFLFCAAQLIYYKIFGTFFTFFSMTNGAGAFQFGATILAALKANWFLLVPMALPLLALIALAFRHGKPGIRIAVHRFAGGKKPVA